MAPPILKRYFIAFGKYKWFGFSAFILAVGASGLVAMQPPPSVSYRSKGVLGYTTPSVIFSSTGSEIQEQGKQLPEEILLAENVLEAVSEKVNEKPRNIGRRVSLKNRPDKGIVEIAYTHETPEKAQAIVEGLMEAMIEQSRLVNTQALRRMIEAIEKRVPEALEDLRTAEQALEEFEREEAVPILAAKSGGLAGAIVGAQNQQEQLQLQLQGIEGQIISLEQRLGMSADQAYVSQALSADPIIAQLRASLHQIESQRELLSKNFRPQHPQMIELEKQEEAYNQLLEERAAEVIGGDGVAAPLMTSDRIRKDSSLDPARQQLAQNLVGLQTEKERLRQQLNLLVKRERELSEQFKTLPNKQKELARLAQQVQLHQGLYNKMQGALADAKAAEAETVSSLNVANDPYVSKNEPEVNSPIVVFILGGIVGILVGNAVIFVLSLLEGKCYTKEEVQNALQQQELRILGILPQVYPLEFEEVRDLPVIVDPDSPYLEFYEKFRTNLLRVGEKPPKVLLMSSVAPKEGKTFCAYNLAIAAARAGKRTLLIETDLRSPTKASALNVTLDPETHLEPLSYYGQLNQCIRLVPEVENLYIVPSPGPVRNSAALLESYEVQQLLKDARVRFDMVILDSPALNVCNDAFLLEPFSDGMVMVTRPLVTEPGMLTEYVEPLTESETVQLLGAVVNGADIPVQFPEISGMQDSFNLPQASDAPRPSLEPTDAAHHAQLPTLPRR